MLRRNFIVSLFSLLTLFACANTPTENNNYVPQPQPNLPVEVSVISDVSGILPEYPVATDGNNHYRAYLQATNNDRYRILINNNSDQRVGVVIAVDGRNVISGQKSYLQNTERMYIVYPEASAEYEGWRTADNQVNRFYFTEAADSYASAWGDNSAMGVIAVAVYPEKPRPEVTNQMQEMARAAPSASKSADKNSSPGTGFGETKYSPSVSVDFETLPEPMEKVFLKYEWPETLCKKGIVTACKKLPQTNENRFWPNNNGYVQPPPPRPRY